MEKSIGSKDRTWKNLTFQASPWYVVSCSVGLDFQKLQDFLVIGSKGGPQWKNDFTEVPPLVYRQKKFCSSWRSRPLEHVSTYYGEAWTVKVFHVLYFDPIDFAKIGSWRRHLLTDYARALWLIEQRNLHLLRKVDPCVTVLITFSRYRSNSKYWLRHVNFAINDKST